MTEHHCIICKAPAGWHQKQAALEQEVQRLRDELDQQNNLGWLPAWVHKGRDGEPVTVLQKLEQAQEFGTAMERLAIENNAEVQRLEEQRNDFIVNRDYWYDESQRLRAALEDLLDYIEPCSTDKGRDYCYTHYNRNCKGNETCAAARAALEASKEDGHNGGLTP